MDQIVTRKKNKTQTLWKKIAKEHNKVTKKLKKQNKFFYKDSGSIFMDYKNLRDSVVPKGEMKKISNRFNSSMSKKDFLSTAKIVAEEWCAKSEIEKRM